MKRAASLAAVVTGLAVLLSGCGSKPITLKGQDALQTDIHKVREAAAGDSHAALVAAITRLQTKTRNAYLDKELTRDRAAAIDAAAQQLLNDYVTATATATPSPSTATSSPAAPSSTAATSAPPPPPPTTAQPTVTETETETSSPTSSPAATDSGGGLLPSG